jgi:hypothetical protein
LLLNTTASNSIHDAQGDTVTALGASSDLDSTGSGHDLFVGQSDYRADEASGGTGEDDPIPSLITGQVSMINLTDLTTVGIGESETELQTVSDAGYLTFTSALELGLGAAGVVADFDGDGEMDGLFGAPLADGGDGALYAVSGLATWVGDDAVDVDDAVDSRVMGTEAGGLGTSIALGYNASSGDGADIMVTEPEGADGLGVVWLVSASSLSAGDQFVDEVASLGIVAQYPTDNIGSTVAMADFDGDGRDDMLIASDQHASPSPSGLVPTGRVSLFLSSRF